MLALETGALIDIFSTFYYFFSASCFRFLHHRRCYRSGRSGLPQRLSQLQPSLR